MRIVLLVQAQSARSWQIALAERLRSAGHEVQLSTTSETIAVPTGLAFIEWFEETLYGRHRPLGRRLSPTDVRAAVGPVVDADLTIDLATGTAGPDGSGRRLVLKAEGLAPEIGIAEALLDRRAPWIELTLHQPGGGVRPVVAGLPAVPDANVLIRGMESVAARLITLTAQAVADLHRGAEAHLATSSIAPAHLSVGRVRAACFAVAAIAEKVALKLKRLSQKADQWVVGWREVADDAVIDTRAWPKVDYAWLADDGLRYYADPFVVAHDGKRYLFVEDYVYSTGRGHLSVATWTGAGWSVPRVCLERPYHLSWPRVFSHAGSIWMVPETSEARTLELYRAVEFPYRWELARVLTTDISLADASWLQRDDGWWMLAAIVDGTGCSSWDGAAVLHADDCLGQWQLTGAGASLVDVRAARPAGDLVRRGDHWLRPVQDCSLAYGGALRIARIDALGPGVLRQTLVAHLPPRPEWKAIGVHTLNAAAGLEVIDINRGFDIARTQPTD